MPRPAHDEPPPQADDEATPELPSKTRRKEAMHALQDLGERLAELPADKLAQLNLPENLALAIRDYRRFNKWEAKRRQMQYIGRLMRDIDAAPIAAQLERWAGTSRAAVAGFHEVETWRDRLLAEPGALEALLLAHPGIDRIRIAALTEKARIERSGGRPPANFRLLFRELAKSFDAERRAADAVVDPRPQHEPE
ncbi:MAG: ribosome biogenesis factor YjgA [Betaproteobacteria bacterium]